MPTKNIRSEHGRALVSGRWLCVIGATLSGAYAFGFLLIFLSDPLGQAPVLDARENLAWAERIASQNLPEEPFYRALLYPLFLSWLPNPKVLAPIFGVVCHLLNAFLCAIIAAQVWKSRAAAWFSGLSYGIYPVALFFAVQILDITFALSFFLLGVVCILEFARTSRWLPAILASTLFGLAFLARPNFLPAALVCPLIVFGLSFTRQKGIRSGALPAIAAALVIVGIFIGQGLVNKQISGEFRILPWQGAYNLYAANREGANGKYYKQTLAFDEIPAGMNPTRMESIYLYHQKNPGSGSDLDIVAMNRFWRGELLERIAADPLDWVHLMSRKAAYIFNDWEQYNNLSYPFHKQRLLWLKLNPLGWGLLFIGAAVAVYLGWGRIGKPETAAIAVLVLAYVAGVMLFFISARFRLPLAPILAVLCGGLITIHWKAVALKRALFASGLLLAAATLCYGNWFDARGRETFKQDQLLLARSALKIGNDEAALYWADRALAADSGLGAARRLRIAALFNRWLALDGKAADQKWRALIETLKELEQADESTLFIKGVVLFLENDAEAAVLAWSQAVGRYPSSASMSAAAVEWVEAENKEQTSDLAQQIGEILKRAAK